jgi:lipopolysaccharide transport system ATP-binding protein
MMSEVLLKDAINPTPSPASEDNAIVVRNVSKMYRIYDQPIDRLKQMVWRGRRSFGHEFWALRNISFEVKRGETIGIIGRNGSGKSTILQIIAGILAPTEGEVEVKGRVTALLELGSGFNPEFTGRENVYLNGTLLGFSRQQMDERFDEIAAFADIGDFIEQPVKLYSSGMFARLAFAIGIHLEPDVFIIDEALSVGDIFFQSRCVRKLDEFRSAGGTVLFVTHDTYTVERICTRAVVIHKGEKVFEGSTADAVNTYYKIERGMSGGIDTYNSPNELLTSKEVELRRDYVTTDGSAYIESVSIVDDNAQATQSISVGEWMTVEVVIQFNKDLESFDLGVGLRDRAGVLIGGAHTYHQRETFGPVRAGEKRKCSVRMQVLVAPDEYLLLIGVSRNRAPFDWDDLYIIWDACIVSVIGRAPFWGLAKIPNTFS